MPSGSIPFESSGQRDGCGTERRPSECLEKFELYLTCCPEACPHLEDSNQRHHFPMDNLPPLSNCRPSHQKEHSFLFVL